MRVLFYGLLYVTMCVGNPELAPYEDGRQIFVEPFDVMNHNPKNSDENAVVAHWGKSNSIIRKRKSVQQLTRGTKSSLVRKTRGNLRTEQYNPKNVDVGSSRLTKRNPEAPSPYLGEVCLPPICPGGARLRLDFSQPVSNGSSSNLRGTAEVVAGQWRIPPGWIGPPNSSESNFETTTVTKKLGFFKGIQNFFKHSFHMDKTTLPVNYEITTLSTANGEPEVTQSSILQLHLQAPQKPVECQKIEGLVSELGKGAVRSSWDRKPSGGREATFNFHIKAVAIPRPIPGGRLIFGSV